MISDGDIYMDVTSSIIKFIEDWRKANASSAGYFDWDAHAQEGELPKSPEVLIGPAGIGMTEEETEMFEVVFAIGVSTYNDKNLFTLRSMISKLFGALRVGQSLNVYDASTGALKGTMVIKTPRAVTPVTKAEIRSQQFIELTAALNPAATSSLR